MLFGRRKPGFSKEVELKPEEIEGEFSDRNDPAMRHDANPKTEKAEYAAMADRVMNADPVAKREQLALEAARLALDNARGAVAAGSEDMAQQAAAEGKTVDLFDYMDSLPEVTDPFPASEDPMVVPEEEKPQPELKPGEVLAGYIREMSKSARLVSRSAMEAEEEDFPAMLEEMLALESCADIRVVKGAKDEFYYSEEAMTGNYAMIAALIDEQDLVATIAHMVRWNCKTYPAPTPLYYFMRHPYNYTKEQLEAALAQIQARPDMKDIKTHVTWNKVLYLYSEDIMSFKYARALAEDAETAEGD